MTAADQRSRDPRAEARPGPPDEVRCDRARDDARKPAEEAQKSDEAEQNRAPVKPRSWFVEHKLLTALIVVATLAAVAAGALWWLNARHYEDTDDAFIDERPSAVGAEVVSAAIVEVPVTDNEIVETGQTLVKLDDRDYRAALAQAEAQIGEAEAAIAQAEAQTNAQQSAVSPRCR